MGYSDPQRRRDAVRAWRKANPELVQQQRRNALVRRAIRERRLPHMTSIAKHKLTDKEIQSIVDAVAMRSISLSRCAHAAT